MKKKSRLVSLSVMVTICLFLITGCGGETEKTQSEMAIGNWTHFFNRAYILLITTPQGEWHSTVRISDVTSKIVKSKGNAKGTWYVDDGQMIFSVNESDIEKVWEKNATLFFDIVSISDTEIHLKDENDRVAIWKKTNTQQTAVAEKDVELVLDMGPVVVNLNKNRSNDKDRYLCLNLNLVMKELMPDQEPPPIHPRVYDAAIMFLSSLIQNDVKDFDALKEQNKKLTMVINPYMEGMVKETEIEHVIVANDISKVEEFIIEHTMTDEPATEDGEEGDGESKENREG